MSQKPTSLEELLRLGRDALREISKLQPGDFSEPAVCFHFFCPDDDKNDRWGEEAECVRLSKPIFGEMPFELNIDEVGGSVGIEAWEAVIPSEEWLEDRLPRMLDVARRSGMNFLGWSFEPQQGPFINAGVNVLNANSPEGALKIEGLIESMKATKH